MARSAKPAPKLMVNRAPVLTLWGSVVAERLGFDPDEALTLGKAVAGLNAQAKGRRLGLYEPQQEPERPKPQKQPGEELQIEVVGRPLPAQQTDQGVRAVIGHTPIRPASVESYLRRSFGEELGPVREAMEALAQAFAPEELERQAYGLYEEFRPRIPAGIRGWGAKGKLDLKRIRSLAARFEA